MNQVDQKTDSEIYHRSQVNQGLHGNNGDNRLPDDQKVQTLNVLLLGEAQSGRSSVGNALIGGTEFQTGLSGSYVTREFRLCCRTFQKFFRRRGVETDLRLRVMDTPPLTTGEMDGERDEEGERVRGTERGLGARRKILERLSEGVHVVVLVVRADVPLHNKHLVQHTQELFGASWSSHALLVLTHTDQLKEAGLQRAEYLTLASDSLRALIDAVGGQYYFLDGSSGWPEIEGRPLRDKLLQLSARNSYTTLAIPHTNP